MNVTKHIPNLLTSCNLICGLLGILLLLKSTDNSLAMPWIAYLLISALAFDFLDGFAARALKANSPIGKELDSLADMVSFGVLPGLMVFELLQQTKNNSTLIPAAYVEFIPFLAFLVPVFSALRLAKFNIDMRQSETFIGLPTPANTLLLFGFVAAYTDPNSFLNPIISFEFLILTCFVSSYLLVAEIPLVALKFKNASWQDNKTRYLLIISTIILFIVFNFDAIPIIIILYIILSLTNLFGTKQSNQKI